VVRALGRLFVGAGAVVASTRRVERALACVRAGGVDFVLCDYYLGAEGTSARLVSEIVGLGTAVAVYTGDPRDVDPEVTSCVPVLRKPAPFEAIIDTIFACLRAPSRIDTLASCSHPTSPGSFPR